VSRGERAAELSADGSTTIYFSSHAASRCSAWELGSDHARQGWFTILHLYSPLEPFFTKEWRPSEIELVK